MYLQEKTPVLQFGHTLERTLEQNSSICPIISYLWMVDLVMRLFSCGANLWRSSANIQPKKGPAPWILFLLPASRPLEVTFLVGEAEHMWLYPFARANVFSAKKHVFCNLGARWHKIFEFVTSYPICGWLTWWCDFLPVGPTFEDHPQAFSRKRSSPLGFIFDPCALASWSNFFGWWSWTYVFAPFCMDKCILRKKNAYFAIWARWHKILEFVPSCPICGWLAWWCDFLPVGPTFEDHPHVFSQKKVQPLGFYFWHLRFGLFKSLFWLVKLNICGCTLLQGQMYLEEKKRIFCNLGACWHTILEFVPSCPICGWSAWWCDFLPVGPTFEDHPQVFSQKRSSPLDFIFDTCASASSSHFFGWWSWTYVFVPFLQSHVKNHTPSNNHGTFFSWGLTYRYVLVNSPPMKIIFLWPDVCTPQENNFEPKLFSWVRTDAWISMCKSVISKLLILIVSSQENNLHHQMRIFLKHFKTWSWMSWHRDMSCSASRLRATCWMRSTAAFMAS